MSITGAYHSLNNTVAYGKIAVPMVLSLKGRLILIGKWQASFDK